MRKLTLLFFVFFYTSSYGLTIEWKPILIKTISLKAIESNIVPIPRDTIPVGGSDGIGDKMILLHIKLFVIKTLKLHSYL